MLYTNLIRRIALAFSIPTFGAANIAAYSAKFLAAWLKNSLRTACRTMVQCLGMLATQCGQTIKGGANRWRFIAGVCGDRITASRRVGVALLGIVSLWGFAGSAYAYDPSLYRAFFPGVCQNPSGFNNPDNPYCLKILDTFSPGSWERTRYGVLLDYTYYSYAGVVPGGVPIILPLKAGIFTDSPDELFFSCSEIPSSRMQVTSSQWNPVSHTVNFATPPCASPDTNGLYHIYLFRKLHFNNRIFDETNELTETGPEYTTTPTLSTNTTKLIVIIHGWNPGNAANSFVDSKWQYLITNVRSAISNSEWKLSLYHWEKDSATGPRLEGLSAGPEAAEMGHQHGQNLGELLNAYPNLKKVQFIAHSAGSWVARSAIKSLLANYPNAKIELTLLDPFIPGEIPTNSSLTLTEMNGFQVGINYFQNASSSNLYLLENIYRYDGVVLGTDTWFGWRTTDKTLRIEGDSELWNRLNYPWLFNSTTANSTPATYFPHPYNDHSGPIQFYADTVAVSSLGTESKNLQSTLYYSSNGGPSIVWNSDALANYGWTKSIFYNEPQIVEQPTNTQASVGASATFVTKAKIRGAKIPTAAGLNFYWQSCVADATQPGGIRCATIWQPDLNYIIGGVNGDTLTINNVTATMNGKMFRAVAWNDAGEDVSQAATLAVAATAALPTISSVSPLTASSSTQTITISGANFTNTSTLVFTFPDGAQTPQRTPFFDGPGQLRYTSTFPTSGGWRVKVVNGAGVESPLFTFYVSSASSTSATLTGLSISGPATVNENGTGSFTATAFFSSGSPQIVSATWNVSGSSASINQSTGQLTAGSVSADMPVTVSASYSAGGITKTASANVAIVNTGGGGGTQLQPLIVNGDFESGASVGWYFSDKPGGTSGSVGILQGANPRQGYWYAYLGDRSTTVNAIGSLHQFIIIPANATKVELSFYLNVETAEPTPGLYDLMDVNIRTSTDVLIKKFRTFSEADKGVYRLVTVDMTNELLAYRGQQVLLQFYADTDVSNYTMFRIDDVSVIATVPIPVTLSSLVISGPTSLAEGGAAQYSATAVFSDGSTQAVTTTGWNVNSGYATISSSGYFNAGHVNGDTVVTVSTSYTYGGVTRTATKDVTILNANVAPTYSSIFISGPNSIYENSSGQFTALAIFSDGSSQIVSPVWSLNNGIASISSSGLLMAGAVNSDTSLIISASYSLGGIARIANHAVTIVNQQQVVIGAPAVSLSSTSLAFADQNVGSASAAQSVTLTNIGNAALNITSITAGANFTETDNCGSSLASGLSCTISVTFTPTTSGTLIGLLSISSDAAGSPHSISLSGTGIAPASTCNGLGTVMGAWTRYGSATYNTTNNTFTVGDSLFRDPGDIDGDCNPFSVWAGDSIGQDNDVLLYNTPTNGDVDFSWQGCVGSTTISYQSVGLYERNPLFTGLPGSIQGPLGNGAFVFASRWESSLLQVVMNGAWYPIPNTSPSANGYCGSFRVARVGANWQAYYNGTLVVSGPATSVAVVPGASSVNTAHTITPTIKLGVSSGSGDCAAAAASVGQMILCDEFSGAALDSTKWQSGGSSVTQAGGVLTISEDITDIYTHVNTVPLDVPRLSIRLRHWMSPANDYFFPRVVLRGSNAGIAELVFLKSAYGPDYCNDPAKFNRVLLRVWDSSQQTLKCNVIGNAASDTFYNRWTETLLSYDSNTGAVTVDLDADGVVDLTYNIPAADRKAVHDVYIDGYGWWTGHQHKLDYIAIGTGTQVAVDTTPPVVTVPANITAEANEASGRIVTFISSASDLVSGALTPTCTPSSGSIFAIGTTGVTCTATDAAGNTGSASFNVTVQDTTPPIITALADVTVEATSRAGASVIYLTPSTSDAVDGAGVADCLPASGSTFALGNTTVTCTATDARGNAATPTTFIVHVADTTPPVVTAPANITVEASGATGSVVPFITSASDLIDGPLVTICTSSPGSVFAIGTTTVICTAVDAAGNTGRASFAVTVQDTTPPIIATHADVTAEATSAAGAVVSYISPATTDAVDSAGVANCLPASVSAFAVGNTTVTCTATDAHGNAAASTTFVVHVVDTTPPVVTVPANFTSEASRATGSIVPFTTSASDLVDGALVPICLPASGSTFAIGTTTVTCTATDAAGNTGSASFTVTVQDTTPPIITAHADVTAEATSTAGASVSYLSPSTSDAVDGAGVANCLPASGTPFALGNTTVTCTATDARGNAATATTFVVHVVDTTPPVVTVPANITAEASDATGRLVTFTSSANDLVEGALATTCGHASGSTFTIGTTIVACSATDAAGNTGSASFTVTVQDTTPPVIAAHADITAEATSAAGAAVGFHYPTTSDAVDGMHVATCTPVSGSIFALGDTTVTCSATDAHSNAATPTTFVVHVADTIPPVITVPANITAEATSAAGAVVNYSKATATDDVSIPTVICAPQSGSVFPLGTSTVTCTATDEAGNNSSALFGVTVQDTTPPVLTVPADMTVDAASPTGAAVTYLATTTDIVSPSPAVSCAPASGSTFPIGDTRVTCTTIDTALNSAMAFFTVTVRTSAQMISNLALLVEQIAATNDAQGIANSLDAKLQSALDTLAALKANSITTACNQLGAFINHVEAQSDKVITTDQANQLMTAGGQIKSSLGCM